MAEADASGEAGWEEASLKTKPFNGSPQLQPTGQSQKGIQPLACPECSSKKLWRDGLRYLSDGSSVQRWLCRSCGYRFSEPKVKLDVLREALECSNHVFDSGDIHARGLLTSEKSPNNGAFTIREDVCSHAGSQLILNAGKVLNTSYPNSKDAKVCASSARGAKNLATVEPRTEKQAAGATEISQADIKGKLLEFAWWLKKQGRSDCTVKNYPEFLKLLTLQGARLEDPESVRETLARLKRSVDWKHHAVCAYTAYLKMQGQTWVKPEYKRARKIPFIPLERELDDLIAGAGKKTAAFLQLLKETGMRAGEALKLRWMDVDFQRRVVILNVPEKGGNARLFKISTKLLDMLNVLPRKSERIFPISYTALKCNFMRARRKLAFKLCNPRLLKVSFHTFRHWKATMEYHKTKDVIYVKELLGHKKLDTTLLYIQIERTLFQSYSDEFTVKIAKTPEEVKSLLEVGFDYVCEKDGLMFFRKRR